MKIMKIGTLFLLFFWQPVLAVVPIQLGEIEVKLDVTAQPRIEIEKPTGGWYHNIKLSHNPENIRLFQAEVPVRVKLRRQDGFKVSIKAPLILRQETKLAHSSQHLFSPAKISWGKDRANIKLLSTTPEVFTVNNGTASLTSADYLLHISALAPSGQGTAGKYHGKLTLIFETNS
ncbi:fimbrial protein [Yersinia massiliensis]|uniref:Fimbrial protein n=1 Tax=Yersinia massiliensis TaxID=419257 RepID=A0ABM6UYG0_9GAMM|nr:fimbrial protein [Yersinia massiliensis]AVX40015.1 fimbrial protein [Yersinia massiliensis]QKJ10742.1 fimbrial protein [Yersinia massiliensis]